jgi:hypothetical protein
MTPKLPHIVWTEGMPPDQKAAFCNILNNNTVLLSRLRLILTAMEEGLDREEISETHFKTPEWAYRQAMYLGRRKALRDVKSLFSFLDHKEN